MTTTIDTTQAVLAVLLTLIWGVSLGVLFYATHVQRVRWGLMLWIPMVLLLGPVGLLIYQYGRRSTTRHSARQAHRINSVRPTLHYGKQPGQPLPTTSPLGSGFFLYVSIGQEATRCVEIPFRGSVSIRRGHATERPAPHELILQDPAVSRSLHCTVTRVGRKLMLEDRSKNGTIVDGQHYLQQRAELRINSIIRVGKTSIRVQAEGQVRPTTQGDE
jgi:hypothetical protein